MKVKDLKIGDICYCVYVNGFLSRLKVVDIKFLMKDKNIVKITYNKLNEIFEMTVTSFINEGQIYFDQGTIYLTEKDAREAINDIIEICNESLAYL